MTKLERELIDADRAWSNGNLEIDLEFLKRHSPRWKWTEDTIAGFRGKKDDTEVRAVRVHDLWWIAYKTTSMDEDNCAIVPVCAWLRRN